jgi:hypothetical protein
VRNAFNSPFWPFVLTTTSVGQEGIDFHWWCHAVVHRNLPANPVDFEQREGSVNRFGGHAVRRNIAARHRASAMTSQEGDPWKAAYDAARDQSAYLGEFAPYWIYPGPFKVERQLINYPLSRDTAKVLALKDDRPLPARLRATASRGPPGLPETQRSRQCRYSKHRPAARHRQAAQQQRVSAGDRPELG